MLFLEYLNEIMTIIIREKEKSFENPRKIK